jgi:hypothetical protein
MRPLILDQAVLDAAGEFFESRGAEGCEGTAMIAVSMTSGAQRLVIPEQRAGVVPRCWAEVTETGKGELLLALGMHDRYAARIHSHPALAFHSATDDANPALTFDGALSIVVPFFGLGLRRGLDACAVLVRRGSRWIEVPPGADRERLVLVR